MAQPDLICHLAKEGGLFRDPKNVFLQVKMKLRSLHSLA